MKKLLLLSTIIAFSMAAPAHARVAAVQPEAQAEAVALKSGDAKVSVNGLVCDFCARALEKVFGKQDEVNTIDVNLDTKIISISFKDGQNLDDETITNLITDAGYNVETINRVE